MSEAKIPEFDQQTKERVLNELISGGVEFDATQRVLARWFVQQHNIVYAQIPGGRWVWKYRDGGNQPDRYDSFHALIEALLQRVGENTP